MLGMHLDNFGTLDSEEVALAASRMIFSKVKVGAIFTHGDPQANLDNRMTGFDINLRKTERPEGRSITAHSFYMTSEDQEVTAKSMAVVSPFQTTLSATLRWKRIGEDFEPAMGFVARRGVDNYGAFAQYAFDVPESLLFRDIIFAIESSRYDLIGGGLQSETHDLTLLRLDTLAGDSISFSHKFGEEVLDDPFEIVDGIKSY